ncbi:MAG: radical SAM protein [Chitinivibrionales bacterium]|nr:radical SAM protein [Chitinivibrionales bacterium]
MSPQKKSTFFKRIAHYGPRRTLNKLQQRILQRVHGYPRSILLQAVSACNLKCEHCFLNNFGKEIGDGVIKILPYDEFVARADKIKHLIRHAHSFYFSGFEALLHKDIFRMMDHIVSINPAIEFPIMTNGNSFTQRIFDELPKHPIPEISVSLDGITRETVESFKTGAVFEKTVETIKTLVGLNLNASIGTVFVLHKSNRHEFIDYLDFVNDLGIKDVYVTNLMSFTPALRDRYLYTPDSNPELDTLFSLAVEKAKDNGQSITLPATHPTLKGCTQWNLLFIDIAGNVAPCDYLSVSTPFELFGETQQTRPLIFGNIMKDDILSVWNGKAFKKFRAMHRSGKELPGRCRLCADAWGLVCSNRTVYDFR